MTPKPVSPYLKRKLRELDEVVCPTCDGEREIETDNNGPIGPCPACKGTGKWQREEQT